MTDEFSRRAFLGLGAGALAACVAPAVRRGGPDAASPGDAELAADLAQTLWVGMPGPTLHPATRAALARGRLGGVALFARNQSRAPATLAALCDAVHQASAVTGLPALIGVDQEGGRVQTIGAPATRWPAMARLGELAAGAGGAAAAETLAAELAGALGVELAALGIDVDFAPVLDVRLEGAGAIGDRALAGDAATVTRLGGALLRGLAGAGVLACAKHFPGHGGALGDSHALLPVDRRTRTELLADEVAPFAALAPALPLVMSAHVAYAGLGSQLPGTLDARVATGLLRDELGFAGVLVSDNLEMAAITGGFSIEDAAIHALRAGCDALLLCHRPDSFPRARAALWREARASTTLRARLAQSAARLRALKLRHFGARAAVPRPPLSVLGAPAHAAIAARLAR